MKIKERLIHLLGGVTEEEFFMAAKEARPMIARESPVRTIKAGYCIVDSMHAPPEKYLKNELMSRIANKILEEKLIQFYIVPHSTGESNYPQDVMAIVKVVPPVGFGEEAY